ncbi:hypothetical protein RHMOL_Rhmol13G0112100 [Rhododendron molle]|uniref:Uncharacterized protein n=1 Tax=Rhododendron molle TaxID=49168 RepID=A0ACC0L720_RHOML|nr:hypothetical protein RHMOL_Rhmol13G0112100 [Rhododendron molle]
MQGIILLLICSTIDSLRPPPCDPSGPTSCISPSTLQLSILYLAITLATIGVGGTRFTLGSMGADQFNHPKHQWSFFNWYMFAMYTSIVMSTTAITYVEDDVSWGWGFGICVAANVVGLIVFVAGSRFYRRLKPKGSPFTGLARVVVAAVQKRNVVVSNKSEDYYYGADDGQVNVVAAAGPSGTFKFNVSFHTRLHLSHHNLRRPVLLPAWQKVTGQFPPPLQRIGIGHVLCALSMAVSAVVESNRLKEAHNIGTNSIVPMSTLWLVPQLVLAGMGEAFHFPGNTALFYQEFPVTLKSTATAMVSMMISIAFYLSTAVVGIVQRETNWLPDNINEGRLDNVYWLCFGLGGVNFVYYLGCAWFYKYQGLAKVADENKA